jgi:hypothetical protein
MLNLNDEDTLYSNQSQNECKINKSKEKNKYFLQKLIVERKQDIESAHENLKKLEDLSKNKVEITSKYRLDSLNKRVKAKFFKILHQMLTHTGKIKLKKLPQKFVTNVSICDNKKMLSQTIKEIYKTNSKGFPNDEMIEKKAVGEGKSTFFEILNMSFLECFENYLFSPVFQKHLKEIEKKNGGVFKEVFEEECKRFIEYYLNSTPKTVY